MMPLAMVTFFLNTGHVFQFIVSPCTMPASVTGRRKPIRAGEKLARRRYWRLRKKAVNDLQLWGVF